MKIKSILSKIMVAAASVFMLAVVSGGNAHAGPVHAGIVSSEPDGLAQTDFTLPGIFTSDFLNFENNVKVKVKKKGKKGFKLKVRKKGNGNMFDQGYSEDMRIKGGRYILDAFFDTEGNFLEGSLKIKGKMDTPAGKVKGTLMTATLDDFVFSSTLFGFNTSNIVCNPLIDEFLGGGGCSENESVIIALEDGGFDPTRKGFKSKGLSIVSVSSPELEALSVAAVPVPAAVWLFGSGLLGLVGMTRRRKH